MLNAIIIDDEQHCIDTLKWELEPMSDKVSLVATCDSGPEGIKTIQQLKPDLVFLDVEMPGMTGFEMLQQIDDINFAVIFVTAYDEFAIHAIRVSALDYLLKPVDGEELTKAVTKATSFIKGQSADANAMERRLALLMDSVFSNEPRLPKVAFPTSQGYEFIPPETILYCNSESNYTRIYLTTGKKILVSKTLKEIEQVLRGQFFFRVHHSHLVNLQHADKYIRGDGGYLVMSDGASIQVSRSRKGQLMQML